MKNLYRIISVLLVLLFSISPACAETIDLSNLSYKELIALRLQVDFAIAETGEWKQVVVPPGEYIVGADIPAGDYTLTTGDEWCDLIVYEDGKIIHHYNSHVPETIGKLTLKDGQIVSIRFDEFIFAPYKGLGF